MATFVIVHGMWSGGWFFQPIARILRGAGHEVYTPTLTGIGEREHLGSPETNLDTHVRDIVNVLEFEELRDVVLAGYSYGGVVVTAVADRVPERIAQIVYLDAWIPRDGEAVFDLIPEQAPVFEEAARTRGDGWRIPRDPPQPRRTPHPLATLKQPLRLSGNDASARLPRTYILFSRNSLYHAPVMARMAEEARAAGWRVLDLPADHDAPQTHPRELADMLLGLA